MERAGIAMGSNVGDRLAILQMALAEICRHAAPGSEVLAAPVYRTAPVHCPEGSPDFYNTVVEMVFSGTPEQLLDITAGIELRLGRVRGPVRHAPRTIDLDLLYHGEAVRSSERLTLPHPRLSQREFVLRPLCDIRPDWIPPGMAQPVSAWLQQFPEEGSTLERVATFRGGRWS